jgi:holo-[acyl-carrier protein] synthase
MSDTPLRHGIDLVDVAEFRAVLEKHDGFAERLFTAGERAYCDSQKDPAVHLAARFAAKEAVLKALGTGLPAVGIDGRLLEIEVTRDGGRPKLRLHGRAERSARRRGVRSTALSLSHTRDAAVASVVMLCGEEEA